MIYLIVFLERSRTGQLVYCKITCRSRVFPSFPINRTSFYSSCSNKRKTIRLNLKRRFVYAVLSCLVQLQIGSFAWGRAFNNTSMQLFIRYCIAGSKRWSWRLQENSYQTGWWSYYCTLYCNLLVIQIFENSWTRILGFYYDWKKN